MSNRCKSTEKEAKEFKGRISDFYVGEQNSNEEDSLPSLENSSSKLKAKI